MPSAHDQETQENQKKSSGVLAAVAGGLAMGTWSRRSLEEADSQIMQFSKRALSPAARLRRRLHK